MLPWLEITLYWLQCRQESDSCFVDRSILHESYLSANYYKGCYLLSAYEIKDYLTTLSFSLA